MRRLALFVVLLLIATYGALYVLFERSLKGPGVFFFEYVEGIIPWLVIVVAVAAYRRGLKRSRSSVRSGTEGR